MTPEEVDAVVVLVAAASRELVLVLAQRPEAEEHLVETHLAAKGRPSHEHARAFYLAAQRVKKLDRVVADLTDAIRRGNAELAAAGVDIDPF